MDMLELETSSSARDKWLHPFVNLMDHFELREIVAGKDMNDTEKFRTPEAAK